MRKFLACVDREAWVRFFVGIGGLVIAFLSALLSTALRESGYAILSAAIASFALLFAGLVGLYTVPYLAKRAARERWLDAFEYEITKEGIVYLAAVLVISIAALNTGNNLLFIIISAMLSAILISGFASAFALRRVKVQLDLPDLVFTKQRALGRLKIGNPRRVPIFSLHIGEVEPPKGQLRWERTQFHFMRSKRSVDQGWTVADWKLVREQRSANSVLRLAPIYVPVLAARSSCHADVEVTFSKRGVLENRHIGLSTRFPFSFVRKTRRITIEDEIIVLPEIRPIEQLFTELPAMLGAYDSLVRGQGHDLYRIREHVAGDAARSVDWKATARAGTTMVREFTKDDDRRLCIVFDNPAVGRVTPTEYERMISDCASTAWNFDRAGISLEFLAPDFEGSNLLDFLQYLAVVQPAAVVGGHHVAELPHDSYSVVFTASEWRVDSASTVLTYSRACADTTAAENG
jgi:uncharacterized protein (DUF58 family)